MRRLFAKTCIALFAIGLLGAATSCEKCRECTVFEKDTSTIYYYERQCFSGSGSSNKIDEWEADLRAKYAGYYVYCNVTN